MTEHPGRPSGLLQPTAAPSTPVRQTVVHATPVQPDGYQPDVWARHTDYSDPGRHRALLAAVPPDLDQLSAVSRNLVEHYRASAAVLPAAGVAEVNLRWLRAILDRDQQRHPGDLSAPREQATRVQGCCRDHALIAAAVLREHGRPARIRYGFASYFADDFHGDHVITETWLPEQNRWLRFDPELAGLSELTGPSGLTGPSELTGPPELTGPSERLTDPRDIPAGPGGPFETAAEAWQAFRQGRIDPSRYGVDPATPVRGDWFIHDAVIIDAAFRAGAELLIWDGWPAMSSPDGRYEPGPVDRIAELIIAADGGDPAAEQQLITIMRTDPELAPPDVVTTICPWGAPPVRTDLSRGPVTDAGHA